VNNRGGGMLSCTHSADDVAEAAEAFRQAVRMLREDEELG